jgi:hypothetical protein
MKETLSKLQDPKFWEMSEEAKERARLHVMQESIRESQRRAVKQLRELKTEPAMRNLDGFYSRIKEQENE